MGVFFEKPGTGTNYERVRTIRSSHRLLLCDFFLVRTKNSKNPVKNHQNFMKIRPTNRKSSFKKKCLHFSKNQTIRSKTIKYIKIQLKKRKNPIQKFVYISRKSKKTLELHQHS